VAEPIPQDREAITPESIRQLARLARLELNEDEFKAMRDDLAKILGYVSQLKNVDTEGIEPLAHALDITNVFRDDEPAPSLSPDEALANAPRRHQDFFSVPAVLD
jgi:aspartyl-tRNA(Asn)/glutamyl-tRNA(Gln) amidotransferase subunit C